MDNNNKTLKDIEREIEALQKNINDNEDECAKNGMTFEEMIEKTKELRKKMFFLSKEKRLLQDPEIKTGRKWKGKFFTIEAFVEMSKNGELIDDDGYGYYATNGGVSDVMILPSDIIVDKYRKDFNMVLWLNK